MLVLTRREGQRVVITTPAGERIVVSLERIEAGQVRLGFDAPRAVNIAREEIA